MLLLAMLAVVWVMVWGQRLLYRRFWDANLSLTMRFSAHEAFEGETLYLTEELVNAKWLPMPWVTVKFQTSKDLWFAGRKNAHVSDERYQNDLFSVMMYQKINRRLYFTCGRRGYYQIKESCLISSDILIAEKFIKFVPFNSTLTVYPRILPAEDTEVLCRNIYGLALTQNFINPDPFAFRSIRDYEPGDALKSVNYKASAKANKLMVNQYAYTASRPLTILLNTQPYAAWPDHALCEEAIRLAASLAERFICDGASVQLIANACDGFTKTPLDLPGGSGNKHLHWIWASLARIDLQLAVEPFAQTLQKMFSTENVYVLISSYHDDDLAQAVDKMTGDGMTVYWIVPTSREMKIERAEDNGFCLWNPENRIPELYAYEVNACENQKNDNNFH